MPGDDSDEESDVNCCPCRKEILNSLWIVCGECETNWHPICCGLEGLTQAPISKLISKKWKCPRCFKFGGDIPQLNEAVTNKPSLSEETISDIISIVNSTVEENLKTLLSPENLNEENQAAGTTEDYETVNRRKRRRHHSIQKALEEQREEEILIDKKKDNLIIYGMPESNTVDQKEEMLEDYRRIKKIYGGKAEVKKEDITHMTRLGAKGGDKIRPIQITLVSQNKRKELLTNNMNMKLLENDVSTNIYVSTDRTKNQRAADKLLRDELKLRKLTNPNLVIRNNKIVPFRPAAQGSQTWASVFD